MQERNMPPFAPVLMQSTRAIGYSLEAAIADIIDNSIAAKAGKVQLSFFPVGDAYVSILDNGTGMDDAQMNIAMQYGSKSPTETRDSSDLGRYGLGLKTASLSQCRVLTVISKQGDQVIGRRWDLDYVIKTGAWSLLILDKEDFASVPHISDLYEQDSGTLVVWQNLDRLLMGEVDYEKSLGRKMDEVRQHLELVFHRYLSGESGIKKLEIVFNGVKLKAADPFLIKKSTQAMDTETLVIRGKRILVTPYILPHISKMTEEEKNQLGGKDGIRKRQGFYVYRKSDVQNYAALDDEKREQIASLRYLHKVWIKHQLEKISRTNWNDICSNYLNRAIAPIAVRAVNQRTGATSLDYFNHKEDGLRVIAVGGNSLSRGLTLEGLGVSYFYRKSQMYDTLLQMGRW